MLLHSLALDRSVWDGLLPFVLEEFQVLVPDLPGHGRSAPLEGVTIEAMADEVSVLIRHEAEHPVILVGLSLGGCVAQSVAVRHPQLVRGLGLIDTTCWYGESASVDWEARAQRAVAEGLNSLAAFQLARWFSQEFLEAQPAIGRRLLEVFQSTDIEGYVATCRAMGEMDLREDILRITAPTSIIVGADDAATSPAHAEQLRVRIAGSGLHVIPGCSHLSAVEQPETVARLLAADLLARIG